MSKLFLLQRPTLAEQRRVYPHSACHVFTHAVQGLSPFATDELRAAWLDTIRRRLPGAPKTRFGPEVFEDIDLLAFATMGNHPHMVLAQAEDPTAISRFVGNVLRAFALRYNHLTGHSGQVFVRPFDLRRLDDRAAVRRAISYVHRNPKHPGLIKRYTSHPSYAAEDHSSVVNVARGLNAFGGREGYVEYFDRYCRQKDAEEAR